MQYDQQKTQETQPKVKFNLSQNGDCTVTVDGQLTEEALEALKEFMNNASYYRQQAKVQHEKESDIKRVDGILVIFVVCVFFVTLFATFLVATNIIRSVTPRQVSTTQFVK